MTHDPLCALSKAECRASQDARHSIVTNTAWCDACQDDCQCNLIAKVRADERINAVQECMETVNVIVWKYHNTHYHERAEVARECQRSLRAVQVMP